MATPPTLTAEYESATWATSTWPRVLSVTCAVGDYLVCTGMHEEYNGTTNTLATPTGHTGGNFTWTLVKSNALSLNSYSATWVSSVCTIAETFNLSIAIGGGGSSRGGIDVLRWAGSDGIGATSASGVTTNGTGAPTMTITTAYANSALASWYADWNESNGSARVARTVNGFTPTNGGSGDLVYQDVSGAFTVYGHYIPDAGAAGSKTVGYSAPSGMKWTGNVVEIRGSAGAPPAVAGRYFMPFFAGV